MHLINRMTATWMRTEDYLLLEQHITGNHKLSFFF